MTDLEVSQANIMQALAGGPEPCRAMSAVMLQFSMVGKAFWGSSQEESGEGGSHHATSARRISFAIIGCLAKDGAHVVFSSQKQQKVGGAMAALQREGLSMVGMLCHMGKAEDQSGWWP
ncbi:hypothetical protein P7K49_017851, partial [Saguinus oedipus]